MQNQPGDAKPLNTMTRASKKLNLLLLIDAKILN